VTANVSVSPIVTLPSARCEADNDDPAVADPGAQQPPGQREHDPGQREQPDEHAELGVADVEMLHEQRGERADRLELQSGRDAGEAQDGECDPAPAARPIHGVAALVHPAGPPESRTRTTI
jgi:hypothetical protein